MGVTARAIHGSDSLGPGTDHPVVTFARKTVVIKYGGTAMEGVRLLDGFVRDIATLRSAGIDLVVVHGGGMRVTDDETMELVERALRQVNDAIARMINRHGARAMGLSAGRARSFTRATGCISCPPASPWISGVSGTWLG
jgi:uridylate kinase